MHPFSMAQLRSLCCRVNSWGLKACWPWTLPWPEFKLWIVFSLKYHVRPLGYRARSKSLLQGVTPVLIFLFSPNQVLGGLWVWGSPHYLDQKWTNQNFWNLGGEKGMDSAPRSLSHALSLSSSLSHLISFALTLEISLTNQCTHALFLSGSHSQAHAHTHTLSLSQSLTHTHALFFKHAFTRQNISRLGVSNFFMITS